MSKIIGLVGFKQVGKSTASKYLEEKHGFVRHNFKDALVQEIKDNFPDLLSAIIEEVKAVREMYMDMSHVDIDWLFENKPPIMRALLQNYGTDVRRKDDPAYWVNKWTYNLYDQELYPKRRIATNVVVDDVRFKNEARAIEDESGILIRLTRPDITTGGTHASETEQLEIKTDYTIECVPGDHESLYRQLDEILSK